MALQSSEPRSIVRHEDTAGHGTFLAGTAAGYDKAAGFTGVALLLLALREMKE